MNWLCTYSIIFASIWYNNIYQSYTLHNTIILLLLNYIFNVKINMYTINYCSICVYCMYVCKVWVTVFEFVLKFGVLVLYRLPLCVCILSYIYLCIDKVVCVFVFMYLGVNHVKLMQICMLRVAYNVYNNVYHIYICVYILLLPSLWHGATSTRHIKQRCRSPKIIRV